MGKHHGRGGGGHVLMKPGFGGWRITGCLSCPAWGRRRDRTIADPPCVESVEIPRAYEHAHLHIHATHVHAYACVTRARVPRLVCVNGGCAMAFARVSQCAVTRSQQEAALGAWVSCLRIAAYLLLSRTLIWLVVACVNTV